MLVSWLGVEEVVVVEAVAGVEEAEEVVERPDLHLRLLLQQITQLLSSRGCLPGVCRS